MRNRISRSLGVLHLIISAYFLIASLSILFKINTIISPETSYHFMVFITALGAIYIPKLIFINFDIIFFLTKKRWRKIQYAGYIFALCAFITIVYSYRWGKFNFQKREYIVEIENLPEAFDGYKIVQLSDMHLGSFSNLQKRVAPLFRQINKEDADIVVFTGDMFNNFASEAIGWKSYFQQLSRKDSMLAVMGNHDYGLYHHWDDEELKAENQNQIKKAIRRFGFKLLLNESTIVQRGEDKIAFVGIENWGHLPMPQHADLERAMAKVRDIPIKILLSHDSDFWEIFVMGKEDIPLTLTGHTHGAQIGFEFGSIRFSPAQFKFKYWDGIYKEHGQYLVVNRGVANVAIPARLGMSPEYVVVILCSVVK